MHVVTSAGGGFIDPHALSRGSRRIQPPEAIDRLDGATIHNPGVTASRVAVRLRRPHFESGAFGHYERRGELDAHACQPLR